MVFCSEMNGFRVLSFLQTRNGSLWDTQWRTRRRYLILALYSETAIRLFQFPSPLLSLPLSLLCSSPCHGDVSAFRKKAAVIKGAPITPFAAKMRGLLVCSLIRCDPLNSGAGSAPFTTERKTSRILK